MKQQIIFKDASISSFISLSGEQPRRERFLSRNFRLDQQRFWSPLLFTAISVNRLASMEGKSSGC